MTTDEAVSRLFPAPVLEKIKQEDTAVDPRPDKEALAAFGSDEKCRAYLEQLRWPEGVRCPRCDAGRGISRLERRGQFDCNSCGYQFSVRVGTVLQDSQLPLWKWVLAVLSHLESAGSRELFDDQEEARALAQHGVTDQRLVVLHGCGDIAHPQGLPTGFGRTFGPLDRNPSQLLGRAEREYVLDVDSAGCGVDEPGGARRVGLEEGERRERLGVARGRDDFEERHAFVAQALRVHLHLKLALALTPVETFRWIRWRRRLLPSAWA